MIPGGSHSTRSIVHSRVSSWASWSRREDEDDDNNDDGDGDESDTTPEDLSRSLLPELEYEEEEDDDILSLVSEALKKMNWKLWIVFTVMTFSGISNVVLTKLQAHHMYNYPTFLNMYSNAIYMVVSFCYILPVSHFGFFNNSIPRSHMKNMSKKPFMIMGLLDAVAGCMQVLASIYLPGTLLVLLPQASIPLSILASRFILRERFSLYQYLGAVIVLVGIVVAVFPVLTQTRAPNFSCQAIDEEQDCTICRHETNQHGCESHRRRHDDANPSSMSLSDVMVDEGDLYCQWISKDKWLREEDTLTFVWSLVILASCIPMVMSTVYKQVALQVQLDPILVNGWVSLFQFIVGIFLVVPAGYASSPKVEPLELPHNWGQASLCLFARGNSIESGCHPDECSQAALWVHLGMLSSVAYTVSMILVLKYGSASLLYVGLTLVVPMSHLVFSLYDSSGTQLSDIIGLIVLVAGLLLFRFGHDKRQLENENSADNNHYTRLVEGNENGPGDSDDPDISGRISVTGRNATNDAKQGFLEFLREPFLLIGDI